jgi:hypothetical protein
MKTFYKHICFVAFIAVFHNSNSTISAGYDNAGGKTHIVVIGTVHESTYDFNSDTLLSIFNKIKPDVILIECDTSYMTSDFKLKEDVEFMFPETIAISKYSLVNSVKLRPYDINGRDIFLDDNKRRRNEANFFYDVEMLDESGKLNATAVSILSEIRSMMKLANEMSNSSATFINSAEGSSAIDTINHYTYNGLKMLIEQTDGLSKYKSYWDEEIEFVNKRNETMMKNILKYSRQFEGKKIIVLCGFAHKNYLMRNLSKISGKENFEVREFYEF